MHDNDKVILTDCDGVLMNWRTAFIQWMEGRGHRVKNKDIYDISTLFEIEYFEGRKCVRRFNESAAVGYLPPLRDAIKYVKKLHEEHGYVFHVITSLSRDRYAGELRTQNLQRLFGENVFTKFVYLDTGEDKDGALSEYEGKNYLWVEDKIENALAGHKIGLDSVVMKHEWNKNGCPLPLMNNWKDIYHYLEG